MVSERITHIYKFLSTDGPKTNAKSSREKQKVCRGLCSEYTLALRVLHASEIIACCELQWFFFFIHSFRFIET